VESSEQKCLFKNTFHDHHNTSTDPVCTTHTHNTHTHTHIHTCRLTLENCPVPEARFSSSISELVSDSELQAELQADVFDNNARMQDAERADDASLATAVHGLQTHETPYHQLKFVCVSPLAIERVRSWCVKTSLHVDVRESTILIRGQSLHGVEDSVQEIIEQTTTATPNNGVELNNYMMECLSIVGEALREAISPNLMALSTLCIIPDKQNDNLWCLEEVASVASVYNGELRECNACSSIYNLCAVSPHFNANSKAIEAKRELLVREGEKHLSRLQWLTKVQWGAESYSSIFPTCSECQRRVEKINFKDPPGNVLVRCRKGLEGMLLEEEEKVVDWGALRNTTVPLALFAALPKAGGPPMTLGQFSIPTLFKLVEVLTNCCSPDAHQSFANKPGCQIVILVRVVCVVCLSCCFSHTSPINDLSALFLLHRLCHEQIQLNVHNTRLTIRDSGQTPIVPTITPSYYR
jgi:hypothetical protein